MCIYRRCSSFLCTAPVFASQRTAETRTYCGWRIRGHSWCHFLATSISLVSWHKRPFLRVPQVKCDGETEALAMNMTAAVAASGTLSQDIQHLVCRFQKARWVKDGSLDMEYLREAELLGRPSCSEMATSTAQESRQHDDESVCCQQGLVPVNAGVIFMRHTVCCARTRTSLMRDPKSETLYSLQVECCCCQCRRALP